MHAVTEADQPSPLFSIRGRCPICEESTSFNAWSTHLRDTFLCGSCGTIPRERAIMVAIDRFAPLWREMLIHESSPAARGVSTKLANECSGYTATQYLPDVPRGGRHPVDGWRCEDMERQTFEDESFDLVVTQDVLEHVFDPDAVFREIARTLRPGGLHIATTPLVFGIGSTRVCAQRLANGKIIHNVEPEYHGNPVDGSGSLVTHWWGYDIANRIDTVAPFNTMIWLVEDKERGIAGPLNEVLVSFKK